MSALVETPIDKNQYLFQFHTNESDYWMIGMFEYNLKSFVTFTERYPLSMCPNWYRLDSVLSLLQEKEQRRLTYTELIKNKRVVINPDEKITKEAAEYLANYVLENHVGSTRYPGINLIAACDRVLSWVYGHLTSGSTATSLSAEGNVAAKSKSTGANDVSENQPAGA